MSTITMPTLKPLVQCNTPHEAIASLCAPFTGLDSSTVEFDEVSPREMPTLERFLLVHDNHMTKALAAQYRVPVDLHVLESHMDGLVYARKIVLTLQETDYVVEYGLARVNLRRMPEPVRRSILEEHAPLGAILMHHNPLRHIHPRWYLRFPGKSGLLQWFDARRSAPMYGRVGTIYVDHEPAIEVLEIATAIPVPANLPGDSRFKTENTKGPERQQRAGDGG